MGNYRVIIKKTAKKDLIKHKKSGNLKSKIKISKIINELKIHPYSWTGKPEQLKHNLTGFWSRRINKKDRLVYKVAEDIVTVYIVSALGHYDDK